MFQDVISPYPTLDQVELAERTLAFIGSDEAAEAWYQTTWLGRPGPPIGEGSEVPVTNVCGSYACFAGWACALSDLVVGTDITYPASVFVREIIEEEDGTRVAGRLVGEVNTVAAGLLGVKPIMVGGTWHPFDANNDYAVIDQFVVELRQRYNTTHPA